ncbi:ATP-binding cassette domain-containing protein [Paludibacter sp. 221]|uniref:ATP-binding cassette domain-containing protein n=1 Tax=Paludibacter sp. 221 TaxID=2302939 RepID=UPI0013D7F64A|nr:ATP-binding cassette domain-containing protein [Paludibacter sp. 221]NDV45912.1 ATP-binding cassette domain-containing protein [Paludibacter sp. 221]
MSIEITNLSKSYGNQPVLRDVNVSIGEGEVVGFLGPNGAGKTTTMKILTGAVPYDEGAVKVCGLEVKEHTLKTSALIGYLPEQNPLYTDMYVKEYLLFVADAYKLGKEKKQRVEKLIGMVGLTAECGKKIGQLSKGYRQRVGLAQALMPDPKVLILDEPTTGLDPNQLVEIRDLIREVGRERTVLLSTHIMQEIKAICNRVVIISKGEIVADYPDLSEINAIEKGCFRFEVEFLESADMEEIRKLPNMLAATALSNRHFLLVADKDIRSEVFDFAVGNNNKLLMIKPQEKTIEDIFRQLTN